MFAEGGGERTGDFACAIKVRGIEGNGRDAGMASAAKFFGEGGKIPVGGGLVPGIRSEGDFGANGRSADADGIDAFGVEQVGDEFVVALKIKVTDIKEDYAVTGAATLAQNLDGFAMAFKQGAEVLGDDRELDNFLQRSIGDLGDDFRGKAVFGSGFDHESELRGRLGKFHGGFGSWELSTVNNVAPVDQVAKRLSIEAEFFVSDISDEHGAGLVIGIVIFVGARMFAKMLKIGGGEEGALVVIEPPSDLRRVRVFEIHDNVFIAVEDAVFPGLFGPVSHAGKAELGVLVDGVAIETIEEGGRSGTVKTAIVETQPDAGHRRTESAFLPLSTNTHRVQSS